MFELSIESEFCAAHAIVIGGEREAIHGHNWCVTVTVGGTTLDSDELLVDFHALEALVARVLQPMNNRSLNDVPPFDRVNPTAEAVARHIALAVEQGLSEHDRGAGSGEQPAEAGSSRGSNSGVGVISVRVTEAPGCAAVYRMRP